MCSIRLNNQAPRRLLEQSRGRTRGKDPQAMTDVTFTAAQGLVFCGIIALIALLACLGFIAEDIANWWDDRKFEREYR